MERFWKQILRFFDNLGIVLKIHVKLFTDLRYMFGILAFKVKQFQKLSQGVPRLWVTLYI